MSGMPWFKFYPSDWLAGTRGLTAAETGIYITLVATMYERGEPLAEDVGRLARMCGSSPSSFKKSLELLIDNRKIERVPGGLWNNRVGREIEKRSEKSEVARQSANRRWGSTDEKGEQKQQTANANADKTQCERDASQKPDTRYQNTTVTAREELDLLESKLCEAAGPALNRTSTGLADLSRPLAWINAGSDMDLDILPAIRRVCQAKPPNSVNGWKYFEGAVMDAKASRTAPVPEGKARASPSNILKIIDIFEPKETAHGQSRNAEN